eukprot:SAG11_NODE_7285_length_1166_cov_1.484536_2_plen_277_part_01
MCAENEFSTSGICFSCPSGQYPNNARTGCQRCLTGWAGRNGVCEQCHPGYAPNVDRSQCTECPYGKYMANTLSLDARGRCATCEPGFQPNQASAATGCVLCPEGRFSDDGYGCVECADPVTEEVNHERTGCQCFPNYFSYVAGRPCSECPENSLCLGGQQLEALVWPAPGYWLDNTTLTRLEPSVLSCAPETCLGATERGTLTLQDCEHIDGCCAEGHHGILCASCSAGFSKRSPPKNVCIPCSGLAVDKLVFVTLAYMVIALVLILTARNQSHNSL